MIGFIASDLVMPRERLVPTNDFDTIRNQLEVGTCRTKRFKNYLAVKEHSDTAMNYGRIRTEVLCLSVLS